MSSKMCSVLIVALAMFGSVIAKPGYASHGGHGYDVDYYVSLWLFIVLWIWSFSAKNDPCKCCF